MKKWTIVAGCVFFGLVAVCAFGGWWSSRDVHVTNWQNAFADRAGTYTMPDGKVFQVSVPKGIVEYELRDVAGKVLLKNNQYAISDYPLWFFYMDSKGQLWCYGYSKHLVWRPDARGEYSFEVSTPEHQLDAEMPTEYTHRVWNP